MKFWPFIIVLACFGLISCSCDGTRNSCGFWGSGNRSCCNNSYAGNDCGSCKRPCRLRRNSCCKYVPICYRPVYYPGYYQGRQLHDAYYQAGYYDYFGNYHSGRWYPQYVQSGRWVHGFTGFVSDPCLSTCCEVEACN